MCHVSGFPNTVLVGVTPVRIALQSKHRKRLTITFPVQIPAPLNSTTNIGPTTAININVLPTAGMSVLLEEVSLNCNVAFTSQMTLKDGAITKAIWDFSAGAGTVDSAMPISPSGYLGLPGNTLNLSTPATPAASSTNVNITALLVPSTTPRISISPEPAVVLDRGFTIEQINDPTSLNEELVADWLDRELFAVANIPLQISIVEIFERGPMQGAHPGIDDKYANGWHFDETKGIYVHGTKVTTATHGSGSNSY